MIGKVHNAKAVTIDGRDCWVASLNSDTGRFTCRMEDVSEHTTKSEAIIWLKAEARRRDLSAP